jgi:DNA-binding LytR/AlgR family response regulator
VKAKHDGVPRPLKTSSFAKQPAHVACDQPVRAATKSRYNDGLAPHRILIHISSSEHRVLDRDDVYYLRAGGGESEIRLRSRTPLIDVRPIGEVAPLFEPFGFVRIHHEYAVNIAHVRLLRFQADGRDWELKLEPPVNRVLPIAHDRLKGLRAVLGESAS